MHTFNDAYWTHVYAIVQHKYNILQEFVFQFWSCGCNISVV